jgi:hypothetical protein
MKEEINADELGQAKRLLFEEQWFGQLFRTCKEYGLDWLRMSAAAYVLSGGDVAKREVDWEYLEDRLSPDNPIRLPSYDDAGRPQLDLIDLATRWGLFQVHGDKAVSQGYKGQPAGLASTGAGIKAGVVAVAKRLERRAEGSVETVREAERAALLVDPESIDEKVEELRAQIGALLEIQ